MTRVLPDGSCTEEDFGNPEARLVYVVYHQDVSGGLLLADRESCVSAEFIKPYGGTVPLPPGFKALDYCDANVSQDDINIAIDKYLEKT